MLAGARGDGRGMHSERKLRDLHALSQLTLLDHARPLGDL